MLAPFASRDQTLSGDRATSVGTSGREPDQTSSNLSAGPLSHKCHASNGQLYQNRYSRMYGERHAEMLERTFGTFLAADDSYRRNAHRARRHAGTELCGCGSLSSKAHTMSESAP